MSQIEQVTAEPEFSLLAILERNGRSASLKELIRELSSESGKSFQECYDLVFQLKGERLLWIVRLLESSLFLRELLGEDWNKTLVFRHKQDALDFVLDMESKLLSKTRTTKASNKRGGAIGKVKRFTRGILINQLGLRPYELEFLGR